METIPWEATNINELIYEFESKLKVRKLKNCYYPNNQERKHWGSREETLAVPPPPSTPFLEQKIFPVRLKLTKKATKNGIGRMGWYQMPLTKFLLCTFFCNSIFRSWFLMKLWKYYSEQQEKPITCKSLSAAKNIIIPLLFQYGLFIHTCVSKNAIVF